MDDPARLAHSAGLAMLARRDLSEAQVRQRLARKGHGRGAIDAAVDRLRASGAIDDRRVAMSIAASQARVKSRGRARVARQLADAGIATTLAGEALDAVFDAASEAALLERAIARRLRAPAATIVDAAHFRRLYAQLVRQGFSSSVVVAALKARARRAAQPDDDFDG